MNKFLLCLLLTVIPATAFADLTAKTKQARVASVVTTKTLLQLQDLEGNNIGEPKATESEPTETAPKPAALILVASDRPLEELIIKVRSTTAKANLIETGVYAVFTAGTHNFSVEAIGQNPLTWEDTSITVTVSGSPTPEPTPTPPNPGVVPIDGPGFRVLFIHETAEGFQDRAIEEAFYSPEVSAFLNANCIKVEGQPDFRRIDPDSQFTDPNHRFAKALKRPRTADPWLIISNGTTGYEGPFPGGKTATLELLRSFVPLQSVLQQLPKIVMYSIPSCSLCGMFLDQELPKLVGVQFERRQAGTNSSPTFDLYVNGKARRMVGFQTAEVILATIRDMQ